DTLERALRRALRFLHLVLDDMVGELRCDGDLAHIVVKDHVFGQPETAAPPARAFAYGTYLVMLHGLACWLVGRRIPLLKADFRCPEPVFSNEWRVLFCQNINFNENHSGISFAAEFLELANIQNERTMKDFLRTAPANFLVKYKNSASLAAKIRHRLRETAPTAWPDFPTLANQLNSSTATLRRRLSDEGQSYRSIMDYLRRDLAISLLSDTTHSIMEIANELGFAETSAFHRAFKKWTGARPSEYRCIDSNKPSSSPARAQQAAAMSPTTAVKNVATLRSRTAGRGRVRSNASNSSDFYGPRS
ncbi:MAG: AraC family transcriptional regulator, partial [Rhodanobacter sp.]